GAGVGGGPQVNVYNADGSLKFSFFAYDPSYRGGVTVATGDVNGDGVEDVVTGSATTSSHVKVFDGQTGNLIASFFAFPGFNGGVNVAVWEGSHPRTVGGGPPIGAPDIPAEIVVGAGVGGGPVVEGFTLGALNPTFSFFAFEPEFRGGVQVAANDQFL